MLGQRTAIKDASAKFDGRHVIFTDVERDDTGQAVSGTVVGVFDTYDELYKECKSLKCEIEVGLFGPRTYHADAPLKKNVVRRALKSIYHHAKATSVPIYLLFERHDNVGESWGQFVGSTTRYPPLSQTPAFLWLKDWFAHSGYTSDDIEKSFLYKTAWMNRNTIHGVVKGDKDGILKYAESVLGLNKHIANGGKVEPLKLKRCSGARYEILDGHHRAACMMLQGYTRTEAIIIDDDVQRESADIERVRKQLANKGRQTYYDFGIQGLNLGKVAKKDSLERFELILRQLPLAEDLTLLDVGCHTGFFTILFGLYGLNSHGINPSEREIAIASDYAELLGSRATFGQDTLCGFLASNEGHFDVVLLLNVFYSVIQAEGKEVAITQLRELLSRTRRYFFFSTSMPDDTGPQTWKPYAMSHDEIVEILSEYGHVDVVARDKDYRRNIYKVTTPKA